MSAAGGAVASDPEGVCPESYAATDCRSRSAASRASAWPSSCRTRSRVRSSSWPIASSVHGSPSKPNRSSRIRRSRSGSASSALRTPWRRSDSSASSNGSAASRSANRSPSSPSSSAPTVWFSETDAWAARERLVDVLDRQAGRLGELGLRRLAAELDLEPAGGAAELLLPLDDVDGHADRARVVGDGALHRLPDPPGRVRRELVAAAPVELLDRAVQPERPLLDQVQERHAEPAVALRDRHDQAEVRLDHPALGGRVAALDRLREVDLLGGGQQLVAADVGEEELQAVGGAADRLGLVASRRRRRRPARPPRRACRPRARSSRARARAARPPRRRGRARARTPRARPARRSRAPRRPRSAGAPDRFRATRATDSASSDSRRPFVDARGFDSPNFLTLTGISLPIPAYDASR